MIYNQHIHLSGFTPVAGQIGEIFRIDDSLYGDAHKIVALSYYLPLDADSQVVIRVQDSPDGLVWSTVTEDGSPVADVTVNPGYIPTGTTFTLFAKRPYVRFFGSSTNQGGDLYVDILTLENSDIPGQLLYPWGK